MGPADESAAAEGVSSVCSLKRAFEKGTKAQTAFNWCACVPRCLLTAMKQANSCGIVACSSLRPTGRGNWGVRRFPCGTQSLPHAQSEGGGRKTQKLSPCPAHVPLVQRGLLAARACPQYRRAVFLRQASSSAPVQAAQPLWAVVGGAAIVAGDSAVDGELATH